VQSGFITFQQRGVNVLDVPLSDPTITIADNAISITLTQEQTLAFTTAAPCAAQIRAILASGKAVASNIVQVPICAILKDGEI
jgi:hypothetical protein